MLRLYKITGDQDYRRAAECLIIPLVELLEENARHPGKRQVRERDIPWPRLGRIHQMVTAGNSVLAAAQHEVDAYGHRPYVAKDSEIAFLRKEYARRRGDVAAICSWLDRVLAARAGGGELDENLPKKQRQFLQQ